MHEPQEDQVENRDGEGDREVVEDGEVVDAVAAAGSRGQTGKVSFN